MAKVNQIFNKVIQRALFINKVNSHLITPLIRLCLDDEIKNKVIYTRNGHAFTTAHSRYSYRYAYHLAQLAESNLYHKMKSFVNYGVDNYGVKPNLYLLTVKPKFSSYKLLKRLSGVAIKDLKKNRSIAFIYKAIENTYTFVDNNKHVHFLIVSTSRINKRDTKRKLKSELNNYYCGKLSIDLKKCPLMALQRLCGYVTKQQSYFPLPFKHNRETGKPQYEIMNALSYGYDGFYGSRLYQFMLEDMKSKGLQRHRLYRNGRNVYVKPYQRYVNTPKGSSISLFNTTKYSHKNVDLNPNLSKHHYSEKEAIRQFLGLNIYNGKPLKRTLKHARTPCAFAVVEPNFRSVKTTLGEFQNAFINDILNNNYHHGIVRRLITMINTS